MNWGFELTLIDWYGVGNTISRIHNDTGGSARGIQSQDSLDGDVESGRVEGLKHDLGHLLSVGFRVEGSLGQKDGVFFWSNSQLVVEGVMPDLRVTDVK